jgi:hypothetical protein
MRNVAPTRASVGRWRVLVPGMRILLYVASALVLLVGVELYVLTGHTERFFAWTIQSELTAAFLGAGYLAAVFLEFGSARQELWARARFAVPTVLVFTVLTLVATLNHLDKFHFGSRFPVASFTTWAWLAIYTFVPVLMVALLLPQARAPGIDPPRSAPIPLWALVLLGAQGAVLLLIGAALFLAPDRATYWPWALTPLTAQAVAAWLLGMATAAIHALGEHDLERGRIGAVAFGLFGLLQLIAVARYPGEVAWERPAAWIYIGFVLTFLAPGLLLGVLARTSRIARP